METKLTTEEKAKVFAMYQGQKVLCYPSDDLMSNWRPPEKLNWNVIAGTYYWVGSTMLSLTPLDKITDEHAIEVATRTDYNRSYSTDQPDFSVSILNNAGFKIGNRNTSNCASFFWPSLHWRQYQYLISKGYAVPLWFGIDHWANGKTAIELGIAITDEIHQTNTI